MSKTLNFAQNSKQFRTTPQKRSWGNSNGNYFPSYHRARRRISKTSIGIARWDCRNRKPQKWAWRKTRGILMIIISREAPRLDRKLQGTIRRIVALTFQQAVVFAFRLISRMCTRYQQTVWCQIAYSKRYNPSFQPSMSARSKRNAPSPSIDPAITKVRWWNSWMRQCSRKILSGHRARANRMTYEAPRLGRHNSNSPQIGDVT